MLPPFVLVPWLYFLPLVAWAPLLITLFVPKAYLPLTVISLCGAIGFIVPALIYETGLPVLCAFCAIEGILLYLSLPKKAKEATHEL